MIRSVITLISVWIACWGLLLPGTTATAKEPLEKTLRRLETGQGKIGLVVAKEEGSSFSYRGEEQFPTASVAKLFTAAAVLDSLHPDGFLTTDLFISGERKGSVLEGDLVIVGGGDPYLVTERLYLLAREIRDRGLNRITGRLVLVEGRFGEVGFPETWPEENSGKAYQPYPSPLGVNFNLISFRVSPGEKPGNPALIVSTPSMPMATEATTGRFGSRAKIEVQQGQEFQVSGSIPAGSDPIQIYRRPPDYHPIVALNFEQALEAAGVIANTVVWGQLPPEAHPWFSFRSLPIKTLVSLMLTYSNNFMAEVLTRELGARTIAPPGTTEKGVEAITQALKNRGVQMDEVHLKDGSGLTRESMATPEAVVSLLLAAGTDWEIGPAFMAALPLAGVEGTMIERFPGQSFERRLRAKTGSLRGIRTLAGQLEDRNHRRLLFCLMMDGMDDDHLVKTEETVINRLLAGD